MQAFITSVDLDKRRISFSLKPSHFANEDFQQDDHTSEEDQEPLGVVEDIEMASAEEDGTNDTDSDAASEDDGDEESEIESMAVDISPDVQSLSRKRVDAIPSIARPASTLKIQGGFQWSDDLPQEDAADDLESSEDSGTDERLTKKKRKKKKQVELDLTADMHTKTPESTADFERVLLGSPNSSYLWIQYMSFQLRLSEIEKAREVAKRALDTINFREEGEKLNVWIALMNLENVYGTDPSLESVFKDAARHCEPKTVHLRLASILDESGKHEVRRKSWVSFFFFLFSCFSPALRVIFTKRRLTLRHATESGRTIQANLQKVWAKLQSLDSVRRTLPPAG